MSEQRPAENDAGIDYALVLRVITEGPDPVRAFRSFVEQEREIAVWKTSVIPPGSDQEQALDELVQLTEDDGLYRDGGRP